MKFKDKIIFLHCFSFCTKLVAYLDTVVREKEKKEKRKSILLTTN